MPGRPTKIEFVQLGEGRGVFDEVGRDLTATIQANQHKTARHRVGRFGTDVSRLRGRYSSNRARRA